MQAVEVLAGEAGMEIPRQPNEPDEKQRVMPARPTTAPNNIVLCEQARTQAIFNNGKIDNILAAAARILIFQNKLDEASILANSDISLEHLDHDNWNGGQDTWLLSLRIPIESYLSLTDRSAIENSVAAAIQTPMTAVSKSDFIKCEVVTSLEAEPEWRQKTRLLISGDGISNQGRVRSDRIATREHDGLLFRSRPEVYFYDAMKSTTVPFAPLPVVIKKLARRSRTEPDFIVFKDGIVLVVEIDGDTWHKESPAEAHARLKFLEDEGVRIHRIKADECDTPEKAREAAQLVIQYIGKLKSSR